MGFSPEIVGKAVEIYSSSTTMTQTSTVPVLHAWMLDEYGAGVKLPGEATVGNWIRDSGVKHGKRRSVAAIREDDAAMVEIILAEGPLGARQVAYRLLTAGLIGKTKQAFATVGERLITLRDMVGPDGSDACPFPIDFILDSGRYVRESVTYSSLQQGLHSLAQGYRIGLWQGQAVLPVLAMEKAGMTPQLWDLADEFNVPLVPCEGFGSIPLARDLCEIINGSDCKTVQVIYGGDFDPSGVHIDTSFFRRIQRYAPGVEVEMTRIFVTPDQIISLGLQAATRPADPTGKNRHARSQEWLQYGTDLACEIEAIPTPVLKEGFRRALLPLIPTEHRDRVLAQQAEERELLQQLVGRGVVDLGKLAAAAVSCPWLEG